ncbi:MAG: tetratricopeptide repeat protein [Parvibaculaceae bacterium]
MTFRSLFSLTIALSLWAIAPAFAAPTAKANSDFETGIEAYRTGDIKTAAEAWTAAAEGGHPAAGFLMGRLYEVGNGVEKSPQQAFHFYEMAANEGNVQAAVKVGLIYRDGSKELGIKKDYAVALKNFEKGALQFWPESQFYIADMYRRGLGVNASRTEGLRWLLLAAKKRYVPADLELARIYFAGEGVLQDRVTGWSYVDIASRYADKDEGKLVNAAMEKYSGRMRSGEKEAAKIQADQWVAEFVKE